MAWIRLLAILGLAMVILNGCVSAAIESDVYVVRTSDGEPWSIGAPAGIPVWSPMGNSVVWGNEDGIYLSDPDERTPTRVTDSPIAGRPAWSPDGTALAFIDRDRASLVVIDLDSNVVRFDEPIAQPSAPASPPALLTLGGPSWAPDGSLLAFVCRDGAGDEVCVIRADGTGRRLITRLEPLTTTGSGAAAQFMPASSNTGPPAWSPDGALLAVAAYPERSGAPSGVFIVNLEEGRARRVSSVLPNSVISWFPDGDSVLFSASAGGRSDALRVSVSDSGEARLTEALPLGARNPAISPDGSRLAVESNGEIVVLGESGGALTFTVSGLRGTHPTWNSDGTSIAFVADVDPLANYNDIR